MKPSERAGAERKRGGDEADGKAGSQHRSRAEARRGRGGRESRKPTPEPSGSEAGGEADGPSRNRAETPGGGEAKKAKPN